jgi:predicted permease
LIRQLLTESVLLALLGGLAGIFLGFWGSRSIAMIPIGTDLPILFDFHFDWRVFAYSFAGALLTGLFVGIVPALRASRGNLIAILHEGGRSVAGRRHHLRNTLVVAQVGGSLMLLVIAGLFTRSLSSARHTNLGFDPAYVLNLTMDPNEIGYNEAQARAFYKTLLDRVRALPGVQSASLTSSVPFGYTNNYDTIQVEGYLPPPSQSAPAGFYDVVSPGYFQNVSIPLLRGRDFADADSQTSPYVAIINEAMAKRFWPGSDAIGHRFKILSELAHSIEIVGIVKDSRVRGITGPIDPYFYVPVAQHLAVNTHETLQLRTAAPPESMIPEMEKLLASLAPDLPIFDVHTMTQALDTLNGLLAFQIAAGMAAVLGTLGLVLAIVGVYGVVSYSASQRTHEIGIRMALGAQRADILKMVLGQGLFLVAIGLFFGLLAAFGATRVVRNFLVGVSGTDPLTYAAVSAILAFVALLACYIPARRAMRTDPIVALRYE